MEETSETMSWNQIFLPLDYFSEVFVTDEEAERQKMDSEKWGCCDYLNMWLLIPWDGLVGGIWESQEKQDQKNLRMF